jgi:hypothetical protein
MEVPWLERELGCSCTQGQRQGCHQGKPDQENDGRTTAASFRQGESHRTQNLQAIARVVKISEGHAAEPGAVLSSIGVICALRKLPRPRPGRRGLAAGTRGDRSRALSSARVRIYRRELEFASQCLVNRVSLISVFESLS